MGIEKKRLPIGTLQLFRGVKIRRKFASGGRRSGCARAKGSEYGNT